jgi:F-type H+-transporting ATPase subunit epsilon
MPIELTIVTPEGRAYQGEVESVVLPGVEGEFGVLEHHEPFLTALKIGGLEVHAEQVRHAAVGTGFAEIHGSKVSVMVSTCEWADEIDIERAARARERAKAELERIRTTEEGEAAYQEYQEAYSRAVARVAVSEKFKR